MGHSLWKKRAGPLCPEERTGLAAVGSLRREVGTGSFWFEDRDPPLWFSSVFGDCLFKSFAHFKLGFHFLIVGF